MSITNVSPCYDVAARVKYVTHGGRGVIMTNPCASPQEFVADALRRSVGKGRTVQAISVVQSFDPSELSVDSPEDLRACHLAGTELAQEAWPECDALVVTHADGEGGCVHNHILVVNDTSDGRAVPAAQRYHRTIARTNDEVMASLSLSVLGADRDGWTRQRERFPEGSFDRELGDAIAATIAEGGFYTVDSYKEVLAKRGITLEEVVVRERGPDGRRYDVLDEDGRPVVAGWRYSMRYSGDEGTGRKAARRRKASSLSPEFTREGVQAAIEAELAGVRQWFLGEEPREAYIGISNREDKIMDKRRKDLKPSSKGNGKGERNTEPEPGKELKPRGKGKHAEEQREGLADDAVRRNKRDADGDPQEEFTYGALFIAFDDETLAEDVRALYDEAAAGAMVSSVSRGIRNDKWFQEASNAFGHKQRSGEASGFSPSVRFAETAYDEHVDRQDEELLRSRRLRHRIINARRTQTEWALARAAGTYRYSLTGMLLLLVLARFEIVNRAYAHEPMAERLRKAAAVMWSPDHRGETVQAALQMCYHGIEDIPDYFEFYREASSRVMRERVREIEQSAYGRYMDGPSL